MTPSSASHPGRTLLSAKELAFLLVTVLFWAAFVIVLGKDTSWDFRNYHWYAPYAFLTHREAIDVVVAHQASYYNPFLDIPFYWLATHTHAWIALGVLGAVQGANVVPLYLIAREALRIPDREIGAGALALLGQTGALTLSMFGTTYYDNVMSVFVLTGLAILVVGRETLRSGTPWQAAGLAGAAGFLTGCAMGLKLPEMPYCAGFAGAVRSDAGVVGPASPVGAGGTSAAGAASAGASAGVEVGPDAGAAASPGFGSITSIFASARSSARVAAPFSRSRPQMASLAPSPAARKAMALPMPELPPVTRTVRSLNFMRNFSDGGTRRRKPQRNSGSEITSRIRRARSCLR